MSDPTSPPPRGMGHPVVVGGIAVIAFVALTHLLRELEAILVPFVLAGFLYFSISPLLDYLVRRLRWPGFVAIPATFAIALFVVAIAGTVLSVSAVEMAQNTARYERELRRFADRIESSTLGTFLTHTFSLPNGSAPSQGDEPDAATTQNGSEAAEPAPDGAREGGSSSEHDGSRSTRDGPTIASPELDELGDDLSELTDAHHGSGETTATAPSDLSGEPDLFDYLIQQVQDNVGPMLQAIASATLGIVSNGLLVLMLMFFMMLGRVVSVQRAGGFVADIEGGVKGYVILKTIISAFTGLAQGTVLWLLGVEFAVVFGFLGFLFNFIPNIGPFIATLAPVPLVLLQPDFPLWMALLAIGIPGLIHFTSGVLETRFMGERFDVHPVVVMLGLVYFGLVWGIVGAFLSTPILAVIRILCSKSENFRPVALALAGKLDEITDGPPDDGDRPPPA